MINDFQSLEDIDVEGKRVLLRVGMDVSLDSEGIILDDSRIVTCIPTIQHLVDRKAKVILLLHIGRPNGQPVDRLRTDRIALRLSRLMSRRIEKLDHVVGEDVREKIEQLKPGEVIFLENLRFHPGEERNEERFIKELSSLGDVYINECFSVSHRNHASVVGLPMEMPSAMGFSLKKEIKEIHKVLENPERPFVTIIGGLKTDKLNAIKSLSAKAEKTLVGGGLAFVFMRLMGYEIGKSKFDSKWMDSKTDEALKEIIEKNNIMLPEDFVVARDAKGTDMRVVDIMGIPKDYMALDIGPKTIETFKNILSDAKTVVWAGPMGAFELERYEKGTKEIAQFIANSPCKSIVGGGDSVFAAEKFRVCDSFTHVSTGGGAFLGFLANGSLPALDALKESAQKFNGEM